MSALDRRPRASVIVASYDEGAWLRWTVDRLLAGLACDDELIVVDDASTDSSALDVSTADSRVRLLRNQARLGPARARNIGAEHARGEYVFFTDAHVSPPDDWLGPLVQVLQAEPMAAVGPVIHVHGAPSVQGWGLRFCDDATNLEWLPPSEPRTCPVPVLPGGFLGLRRELFLAIGGFDGGMRGYGMEDVEFSVHMWVTGNRCLLVPAISVGHFYRSAEATPLYQHDWRTSLANIIRFGVVHLGTERLARLVACYVEDPALPQAMAAVLISDALARRRWVEARRRHDDDWFFESCNTDVRIAEAGANGAMR